jgi:hypothetical protein
MSHQGRTRKAERGATLLIAMGLVAVVAMGTLMSLKVVSTESDIQAASRHQREAYFAAEAGLAEARERVALMVGAGNYSSIMDGDLAVAADVGAGWFDVYSAPNGPWVPYTLEPGSAVLASELPAGVELADQRNVRYRVFLRDDLDDTPDNRAADTNNQVWLVAVGEVTRPGGQPTRAVVQALVTTGNASTVIASDSYGQKGGSAAKDFTNSSSGTPVLTVVRTLGGP